MASVTFFKNGDPYFPGLEFRFRPGRDVMSLEGLLDKLSIRMDLPRGARYIFTMTGHRLHVLEELEDGANYVVSSYKTFKVVYFPHTPTISDYHSYCSQLGNMYYRLYGKLNLQSKFKI